MVRRAFLLLMGAWLLASPAAWAAPIEAAGRPGAAWPQAISQSLALYQAAGATPQILVLGKLAKLDPGRSWDASQFTLLVKMLEPLDAAQRLTPESFAALPPEQRQEILAKAAEKAYLLANAKAADLSSRFRSGNIPENELRLSKKRAETLLLEDSLFLSPQNQAEMQALAPALGKALVRGARKKIARRMEEIGKNLEGGVAERSPAAGPYLSGYDGWLQDPSKPAAQPSPGKSRASSQGRSPEDSFDLEKAATEESALASIREWHMPGIRESAQRGNPLEFETRVKTAFQALEHGIWSDGLAFIAPHPLGPWARAKIGSYKSQIDQLYAEIHQLQLEHGLTEGDRGSASDSGAATMDIPEDEAWNLRNDLMKTVEQVENHAGRRKGQDAHILARSLALEKKERPDEGEIERHSLQVIRYHGNRIQEALSNPDPNHISEVRKAILDDRWLAMIPPATWVMDFWSSAAQAQKERESVNKVGLLKLLAGLPRRALTAAVNITAPWLAVSAVLLFSFWRQATARRAGGKKP